MRCLQRPDAHCGSNTDSQTKEFLIDSKSSDESALTVAAARARAATDRALAAGCGAGVAGIIGSFAFGHPVFALPFISLVMFGAWGMLDHFTRRNILRFSRPVRTGLRRTQQGIATIGVIAVMAFAFVFFGDVLGVIVS